jgi:carbon storage regulator
MQGEAGIIMLYITRKIGESVVINDDIYVKVIEIKGKTAKIGFVFPQDITVLREEVYERIRQENQIAAESAHLLKEDWI